MSFILKRACTPEAAASFTPEVLREHFHLAGLFKKGSAMLAAWEVDRTLVGGIVPGDTPIPLEAPEFLHAGSFCERREAGVLNIGGPGSVEVDGQLHEMQTLDGLYLGRGSRKILFASADSAAPAQFYLLSYPAHAAFPTTRIPRESIKPLELGEAATANERHLFKVIQPETVASCQLVMGYTAIQPGSVWNTMPPHTHERRSEVYCYFGMEPSALVVHLMGEPQRTRHLVMRNQEVVLSPPWSIHAGAGTAAYAFIWGMGGENQDFTDMDGCPLTELL